MGFSMLNDLNILKKEDRDMFLLSKFIIFAQLSEKYNGSGSGIIITTFVTLPDNNTNLTRNCLSLNSTLIKTKRVNAKDI